MRIQDHGRPQTPLSVVFHGFLKATPALAGLLPRVEEAPSSIWGCWVFWRSEVGS